MEPGQKGRTKSKKCKKLNKKFWFYENCITFVSGLRLQPTARAGSRLKNKDYDNKIY